MSLILVSNTRRGWEPEALDKCHLLCTYGFECGFEFRERARAGGFRYTSHCVIMDSILVSNPGKGVGAGGFRYMSFFVFMGSILVSNLGMGWVPEALDTCNLLRDYGFDSRFESGGVGAGV
jgi:hypothetical protein